MIRDVFPTLELRHSPVSVVVEGIVAGLVFNLQEGLTVDLRPACLPWERGNSGTTRASPSRLSTRTWRRCVFLTRHISGGGGQGVHRSVAVHACATASWICQRDLSSPSNAERAPMTTSEGAHGPGASTGATASALHYRRRRPTPTAAAPALHATKPASRDASSEEREERDRHTC